MLCAHCVAGCGLGASPFVACATHKQGWAEHFWALPAKLQSAVLAAAGGDARPSLRCVCRLWRARVSTGVEDLQVQLPADGGVATTAGAGGADGPAAGRHVQQHAHQHQHTSASEQMAADIRRVLCSMPLLAGLRLGSPSRQGWRLLWGALPATLRTRLRRLTLDVRDFGEGSMADLGLSRELLRLQVGWALAVGCWVWVCMVPGARPAKLCMRCSCQLVAPGREAPGPAPKRGCVHRAQLPAWGALRWAYAFALVAL